MLVIGAVFIVTKRKWMRAENKSVLWRAGLPVLCWKNNQLVLLLAAQRNMLSGCIDKFNQFFKQRFYLTAV